MNPYNPPQANLDLLELPVADQPLATRLRRLGAVLIDFVIVAVIMFAVVAAGIFAGITLHLTAVPVTTFITGHPDLFGFGSLALALLVISVLFVNGQTPGKRWLGIKIVRMDGSACSKSRYIFKRVLPVTLLAKVINLALLGHGGLSTFGIGSVLPVIDDLLIFSAARRCLHDRIADTKVIDVRQ